MSTDMNDNVINMFPKKEAVSTEATKEEQPLRQHFEHFLNTLDESIGSFHELSVMEKLSTN